MDLNQLLFHHQVALLNADETAPCASRFTLVKYYASKINSLQEKLGAFVTPTWLPSTGCPA